jgi:glycerophosphoryl diester phosphodiesterase
MENKKPLIIAHRGASAYAPENTMAAFQKAVDLSADGIEFDVKCSKDGEMVIIHDQSLERTTNGRGKVIETDLKDLRNLDAGSFYSSEFTGEKIPLLSEVLEEFSKKLVINIELTNYSSINDGLARKAANLVKRMRSAENLIFSSFHPYNLIITRRIMPNVSVALLALPGVSGWIFRSNMMRWISPEIIHPFFNDVDKRFIEKQHQKNRKVNVWTVNTESQIIKLLKDNVDGLITDDPSLARRLINK